MICWPQQPLCYLILYHSPVDLVVLTSPWLKHAWTRQSTASVQKFSARQKIPLCCYTFSISALKEYSIFVSQRLYFGSSSRSIWNPFGINFSTPSLRLSQFPINFPGPSLSTVLVSQPSRIVPWHLSLDLALSSALPSSNFLSWLLVWSCLFS